MILELLQNLTKQNSFWKIQLGLSYLYSYEFLNLFYRWLNIIQCFIHYCYSAEYLFGLLIKSISTVTHDM